MQIVQTFFYDILDRETGTSVGEEDDRSRTPEKPEESERCGNCWEVLKFFCDLFFSLEIKLLFAFWV